VIILSLRFMNESRDPSRSSRVDWAGAALAGLGLGAIVFALLEWPRAASRRDVIIAIAACGAISLAALIVVERRARNPMLPLGLFRSRTFTLANLFTLLLYAALAAVLWLLPLDLIEVQHYSATSAGAALLPFTVLMLSLSRWSGGLVNRVGSRLPLTGGALVAACGLALLARPGIGGTYWVTFFPAVLVLGLGMAVVVAPLTTTAMGAVEAQHAGVASGVNNAVSRVAGLIAIAVFGLVLVRTFDLRARIALDRLELPQATRAAIDQELPKLAGAEVTPAIGLQRAATVRLAIDESFLSAFRVVMLSAAGLAVAAALVAVFIR
jgi:predicted MFS family arabinose efflux permease